MTASQLQLINFQQTCDSDLIGLSIGETLTLLLHKGREQEALELVDRFKISQKRFLQIKVNVLLSKRQFVLLTEEVRKHKSGISLLSVIEECVNSGAVAEARKYILMLPDSEKLEKLEWLCTLEYVSVSSFCSYDFFQVLGGCDIRSS